MSLFDWNKKSIILISGINNETYFLVFKVCVPHFGSFNCKFRSQCRWELTGIGGTVLLLSEDSSFSSPLNKNTENTI